MRCTRQEGISSTSTYGSVFFKPEGKKPLERSREAAGWIHVNQDRDKWRVVKTATNPRGFIIRSESFDLLSDCKFSRTNLLYGINQNVIKSFFRSTFACFPKYQ
jgi:hypothetical protein